MAYYDHITMLKLGLGRWRPTAASRPAPEVERPAPRTPEEPAKGELETDERET